VPAAATAAVDSAETGAVAQAADAIDTAETGTVADATVKTIGDRKLTRGGEI
jgi:hypothetical protein